MHYTHGGFAIVGLDVRKIGSSTHPSFGSGRTSKIGHMFLTSFLYLYQAAVPCRRIRMSSTSASIERYMQLLIKISIKMGFTNRKFFTNQDFELLDGGLKITKKSLFEYFEFEIPYDHIANKKKIQSTINNNLFVLASSFIILGILFLLGTLADISPALIIIGLIFFAITFIAKKQTVTIACFDGNTIELNYSNKKTYSHF